MSEEAHVLGVEVVEQLIRAIRGDIPVSLTNPDRSWNNVFAGDCEFAIGDWKVAFFNDCDELDYCDRAEAPDGRKGDFDDWYGANQEPVELLSEAHRIALERILEKAS